jgi:mono/diheme cytochrome c family protein
MSPTLKRITKIFAWTVGILIALVAIIGLYIQARWDAKYDRPVPTLTAPKDSASIARGEYIFKFQAQCWGCHASGTPDANSPPSGGRVFDLRNTGPGFGVWYTPNLTPDKETGLGTWSDGEIVEAIREGLRNDRTAMFPLMPTDWFHGISDSDALALVAYLRSIPPVSNRVPPQQPSFFAKALFTFGVLKPQAQITKSISAPPPGVTVDYGRYVTNNLADCMDCHTPRSLTNGAFFLDSLGAGGTIRYGADENAPLLSYASNITPDKETGIGNWDEAQFLTAVTTGVTPDSTVLVPHMPYAYFKSCTENDLKAIYLYLRTLPPIRRSTPPVGYSQELISSRGADRGRLIFAGRCQTCHGVNGRGAQPTNVTLAEVTPSIGDSDLKDFIRAGNLDLKMPSFGKTLRDDELNDLVAFIRTWEKK